MVELDKILKKYLNKMHPYNSFSGQVSYSKVTLIPAETAIKYNNERRGLNTPFQQETFA